MEATQQSYNLTKVVSRLLFILCAISCLTPYISSAVALMMGIFLALTLGNPFAATTKDLTHRLLQASIIGLGAGMNLSVVGKVGIQGIGYTALGIFLTFALGVLLGKLIRSEPNTSLLITVGTAICGGSAIAAVASTINAKPHNISVALATVFFLNALALFIFPPLGHYFQLTEVQFGLLSALAIHDTSSVVGAAIQYGSQAVEIATTVKLARALWIVPVSLAVGYFWNRHQKGQSKGSAKRPWFILGFLISAALVTWFPVLQPAGSFISALAKKTLVLTLFFIGCGLTRDTLRAVGFRPFLHGLSLWILVSLGTLSAILFKWIS